MTEPKISEAAFGRADDLSSEDGNMCLAFARYIQTTSDVAKDVMDGIVSIRPSAFDAMQALILPYPKDPLEDALDSLGMWDPDTLAKDMRAELAKRGLHITEIGE